MGEMVKGSVIFQGTDRILHFSHRLVVLASLTIVRPPSELFLPMSSKRPVYVKRVAGFILNKDVLSEESVQRT